MIIMQYLEKCQQMHSVCATLAFTERQYYLNVLSARQVFKGAIYKISLLGIIVGHSI